MKKLENKKRLVIIAGVTGSIGQEVLRHYLVDKNTIVYGISRKGVSVDGFNTLPLHNLVVNTDLRSIESIKNFVSKIADKEFKEVTYYHVVGEFKTEINQSLDVVVENDQDKDGINDSVFSLVAQAYITMTTELNNISLKNNTRLDIVSFGSLVDKYNIPCFQSFTKSRGIVKRFSQSLQKSNKNLNIYLFETSTLLAADELIERPFIFATDVSPVYWITPFELVTKALGFIALEKGFVEKDIYLANPNFSEDYFDPQITYKRRIKELYNKTV
jgi:NADP-dependent 3-hydroxy acid dehydrogenase YdfG